MENVWKQVFYDGEFLPFEVSEKGVFRDIKTKKIIKQYNHTAGYLSVSLQGRLFLAHRLVLSTFQPNENFESLEVNHKDYNKKNNAVENLEWVTREENMQHAYKNGDHGRQVRVSQYDQSGKKIATYHSIAEAVKATGIRQPLISGAISGKYQAAGGYRWSRNNETSLPPVKQIKRYKRPVSQINPKTNELIAIHDSASEAARVVRGDQGSITRVCQGKRKTAYGYKWEYYD